MPFLYNVIDSRAEFKKLQIFTIGDTTGQKFCIFRLLGIKWISFSIKQKKGGNSISEKQLKGRFSI